MAVGPTKLVGGEFDIIARPPPGVKDGVEYVSASAESEPRISTITLRNKKNAPQRYRLFLQGLLEVDTPLDGVILPYEELEICLRLDDRLLRRAIPMSSTDAMFLSAEEALSEVWHFTGVTIMSPNYAVQHINFGAMLEEAMTIDVCRFPLVNPIVESRLPVFEIPAVAGFGKKDMRNVLIRNRSDVEIAWSANVVTFRGPMTSEDVEEPSTPNSLLIGSGSAATAGLPQVFQMVASEGKLKPFASTELSIMVQVTQSGDYVGKLWLNYEDFSPIDNATTGPHRLSEPILLSYSFGMVDLHLSKDMLDMGDVGVSDPNMQALELFNKSTMPARDTMVLCKPPWLLDTCFLSVPSSASARMSLSLRNDKPTTASTLDVAHDLFQHSFPVPGSIGCFSMGSNLLAWPLERMDGPSPVTRLHDFGLVPRHHSKYKPFILSNIGTVTFNINAIRSADHCLACRVPPLHPDAVSDRICNLTDVDYSARMFDEGHLEVDWEEVEHHRLAPHIIVLDVLSKPSAMVHKLQAADRQLPLVMRPGQSALFWLFFGGFEVGQV